MSQPATNVAGHPIAADLLQHSAFVQQLAHRLVYDPARVDDVVQETWLRVLEKPPVGLARPKAWLAKVLANVAASNGRHDARREHRERQGARQEALPGADELAAEAEHGARLQAMVLALPEPYPQTLLLRFHRGLAPREIAEQLGLPVSTIKSRIRRGLDQLRDNLDESYGDRESWALALLPLARLGKGSTAAASAAAKTAAGKGAVLKGGVVLGVSGAAGLLAIAGFQAFLRPSSHETKGLSPSAGSAALVAQAEGPVVPVPMAGPQPKSAGSGVRSAVLERKNADAWPSPAEPELVTDRLVDREGRALSGLSMAWFDAEAVQWEDEKTKRTIVGQKAYLTLEEGEAEALLADPDAAREFLSEHLNDPLAGWLLLQGEEPGAYTATTAQDGSFTLRTSKGLDELSIEDPGLQLHSSWQDPDGEPHERVFLVVSRVDWVGRLLDGSGQPLAFHRVEVAKPPVRRSANPAERELEDARRAWIHHLRYATETDAQGEFRLALEAGHRPDEILVQLGAGRSTFPFPIGEAEPGVPIEIRLPDKLQETLLQGRVLSSSYQPLRQATLLLDGQEILSDGAGLFELSPGPLSADSRLYVMQSGYGVLVMDDLFERFGATPGAVRLGDLVLPDRSMVLAGRITDVEGRPRAGVPVRLRNPTVPAGAYYSVEGVASGRRGASCMTDPDGRYRLDGLLEQEYVLNVGDERAESGPFLAGSAVPDLVYAGK